MAKPRKLDPKLQEDVDFLSTLLAKGLSGLVEFGFSDGVKMNAALNRVRANKASSEMISQMLGEFCRVNPQASTIIEMAAMASPALKNILENMRLRAKDVTDVEVKS